jgi:hypothetical protein
MHGGLLMALRQYLMYAKGWQRTAIGGVLILAGVALVAVGHITGVPLVVVGVGLAGRTAYLRLRNTPDHRTDATDDG